MKRILLAATATLSLVSSASFAQQASDAAATPEVKQFQGLEDQWSTALMKRDQYTLENLMAPTYLEISASGDITTRNQQIADLYAKTGPQPVSLEHKVVNIRTVEDVTIVDGTYIHKWKVGNSIHEERGIFTHVYQRAHGGWVCIHAQQTEVVEKADDKTKPKAEKKSNAELPFHVPFFHKGAESTQDSNVSSNTTATPASSTTTTTNTAAPQP
ncbi:nuclear transport factor 2 family protein [Silvibacterium dinghuense]|uniref:Nuclear transport factor 2 family protein n=1 Tax=Silvibacterium dinghuense TaxID=1560006 RepID=A0A4Q1SJA6_9BACT|nr:nuclear transport factor 2 family protein [Silvibacterium dinghuense]RXS97718.1 nuclear transport factor 2 family protein [Silvibacterium dinghuense]